MSMKEILETFTRSYVEKTRELTETSFGFLIDEHEWWTISIHSDRSFQIRQEKPTEPTFYFTASSTTLKDIVSGNMRAPTAMAKARASDRVPMDVAFMEGYELNEAFDVREFVFRYFSVNKIEKIMLGKQFARIVHGGYAIPLVYARGLRTAWYRIEKDMIINEDPQDQTNPFPTLVIATKGTGYAQIDGRTVSFSEGEAYYIPEHVAHMFWTDSDECLEFIIIMYGGSA
ncbi:hypothetical protein AMJ87_11310 [candidate division WOR_3 bacterium SM23_60]|uniref:Cupin type-2 domain-containing protein n=1 Tax=candidate division WOR_3 bacterium SM23_60 TaxID=1703780 RepID=A0A0S8G771_UNCW3|nr:MAG: hypothetical protein AMJ87_11310 [candidate division WOR_3 bacterium SM23_60]